MLSLRSTVGSAARAAARALVAAPCSSTVLAAAPAAVAVASAAPAVAAAAQRSFTHRAVRFAEAASTATAEAIDSASAAAAAAEAASVEPQLTRSRKLPAWADAPNPQLLSLGNLQSLPKKRVSSSTQALRYGRGRASGLGKTAGRGIKGQGQRKGLRKRGFEGGSTPFWRRMPKIGHNTHSRYYKMLTPLTLSRVEMFVKRGRIDGTQLITMKTLLDSGCLPSIPHGVKLLSGGVTTLDRPLHLQVTDVSSACRSVLESNQGSVHLVWFNRVTLRAHLNPLGFLRKYGRLPKHTGVPPPKKAAKYGFVVEHVDY